MLNLRSYFPWYPIIPTAYDDSFSYLEFLAAVNSKLNSVVEYLKDQQTDFETYVAQQISESEEKTDEKLSDLKFELEQNISDIETAYQNADKELKSYIDSQVDEIYNWVVTHIPDNIQVYDPTTGWISSLSTAIGHIYDSFRYFALTANEYDNLKLTAESYDNKKITAKEYDFYGKYRLSNIAVLTMFNPITGNYEFYQNVIYAMFDENYRGNALTASEYDALSLTAQEYDEKLLTAYQYDFNGKGLLT